MKVLLSHPTGNANVRGALAGFYENGMLAGFHTSIACFPDTIFDKLAHISVLKDLKKRSFDSSLQEYTKMHPYKELGRMAAQKFHLNKWLEHETGRFSVDKVYHHIDVKTASYISKQKGINAVYAYEDGALATFEKAKELGITCVYDLPIAYWEYGTRLMKEEAERLPDWAKTIGGGISDSTEKRKRKIKELEHADIVVCPSSFVKKSLPEWASTKQIIEVPFGTPQTGKPTIDRKKSDKLRVLFVGSMGQRKGLGDLFEAIKLLNNKNIELVVLCSHLAPIYFYNQQLSDFTYEPTRPHNEVLELMRSCDIFCLPSIVEGRALVMQEAMSQGLPLIITPNTGGEDLIIDKETGFLVPIRSPHAIAEKINWFLENREQLSTMANKSIKHASSYTWKKYGNTIVQQLKDSFKNTNGVN